LFSSSFTAGSGAFAATAAAGGGEGALAAVVDFDLAALFVALFAGEDDAIFAGVGLAMAVPGFG
jgi:hypothetical protein